MKTIYLINTDEASIYRLANVTKEQEILLKFLIRHNILNEDYITAEDVHECNLAEESNPNSKEKYYK